MYIRNHGVICEHVGIFSVPKSPIRYPEKQRRIKYYEIETKVEFVYLTNNFDLTATEIAFLYKNRWHVELFFKWMKQHFKARVFWGILPIQ